MKTSNERKLVEAWMGNPPAAPAPLRFKDKWHMGLNSSIGMRSEELEMHEDTFAGYHTIQFTRRLCTKRYPQKEKAIRRHKQLGGDTKDKCFRTGRYWCFYKRV